MGTKTARRIAAEHDTDHVVVLDVPLLVETGRRGLAAVIVVDVPTDVAVERLVSQRGMSESDMRARVAAQASREERLAKADIVIDNSGKRDALESRVAEVWEQSGALPHVTEDPAAGGSVTRPR